MKKHNSKLITILLAGMLSLFLFMPYSACAQVRGGATQSRSSYQEKSREPSYQEKSSEPSFTVLNKYKYFVFPAPQQQTGAFSKLNNNFNGTVYSMEQAWLTEHGISTVPDAADILRNGALPSEIIYLKAANIEPRKATESGPAIYPVFTATDGNGTQLIMISDNIGNFGFATKTWEAKLRKLFEPYDYYHYAYQKPVEIKNEASVIPQRSAENALLENTEKSNAAQTQKAVLEPQKILSDVDQNIPTVFTQNEKMFAVIIGNEDYATKSSNLSPEVNVPFAVNDAKVFKEYCIKTLGIPEQQIRYFENATYGQLKSSITWLSSIAKVDNGKAKIIFYYAGHGIPDEASKSAYLMPVDGVPSDLGTGIKLADLYKTLGEANAESATVFLDACFSGGGRNAGLLAARAVRIKPKEESMSGNLVVFSASSGDETSLPYQEKYHGLFTYFLLKELQKNKGSEAYGEMAENIKNNVALQSLVVNNKLQTPQVNTGADVADSWKNWRMK